MSGLGTLELKSDRIIRSPANSFLGPRSVPWSILSASVPLYIHSPFPLPGVHVSTIKKENPTEQSTTSAEFLNWKRLHLSKAKLSITPKVAAFMAGFSVVATVELQINDDPDPILLTAFTVTTSLLVCTTMLTIMISTCLLPHIKVVAQLSPDVKVRESPHDLMMHYIDLSWVLANSISIVLFTLDIIILCWIKFTYFSVAASWCATAILSSALLGITVFGIIFFRRIVKQQHVLLHQKYEELEEMQRRLDATETVLNV